VRSVYEDFKEKVFAKADFKHMPLEDRPPGPPNDKPKERKPKNSQRQKTSKSKDVSPKKPKEDKAVNTVELTTHLKKYASGTDPEKN
jgi:hypothetical protein